MSELGCEDVRMTGFKKILKSTNPKNPNSDNESYNQQI
jgi:hypothetical protein